LIATSALRARAIEDVRASPGSCPVARTGLIFEGAAMSTETMRIRWRGCRRCTTVSRTPRAILLRRTTTASAEGTNVVTSTAMRAETDNSFLKA
jgi:hypothetical protein